MKIIMRYYLENLSMRWLLVPVPLLAALVIEWVIIGLMSSSAIVISDRLLGILYLLIEMPAFFLSGMVMGWRYTYSTDIEDASVRKQMRDERRILRWLAYGSFLAIYGTMAILGSIDLSLMGPHFMNRFCDAWHLNSEGVRHYPLWGFTIGLFGAFFKRYTPDKST